MGKTLVAYFSASGETRKVAERISSIADAELFEIKPAVLYTEEDLNWQNKNSRSSVEMNNPASRPELADTIENFDEYETIILGFPIWWYTAPTIIKTFLEAYDFSGKRIALFATSGGSGLGKTKSDLKGSVSEAAQFVAEKMMNQISDSEILNWIQNL